MPAPKLLSKTKLLRGYRCEKCLYLSVHHPTLETPVSPELQALFDQGNAVGAKAREYYPGGTWVDCKPWDFTGALTKTRALIEQGAPVLYEAAFEYQGCYARADIIRYSPQSNRWHIIEVKSSTKIKPEHYEDIGLQAWIMAKSGLPIEKISLAHINNECRYPDLSHLFIETDVTEAIRERYLNIQPTIKNFITTLQQPHIPDIDIGPHCHEPTDCGFIAHCWREKNIPPMSIFNLPNLRQRQWELYHAGIISLDDPRLNDLTPLQARVVHCFQTGERYIDPTLIKQAIKDWTYPLVFLDFETINPAIPRYDGCRPFEHVPFQFSVHVLPSPGSSPTHHEYLHDTSDDPRPTLIAQLLQACGQQGSIVAYYGRFESDRIQALADYSSIHRADLLALTERIVDPLPILRDAVYDNAFQGSFSLKKVAPALLGDAHSYEHMPVANGNEAQRGFAELISPTTSPHRQAQLKSALLAYCKQDTWVMVELVRWLYTH